MVSAAAGWTSFLNWYRESAQESDAGAPGTPDCCFEHAEQTLIDCAPPAAEGADDGHDDCQGGRHRCASSHDGGDRARAERRWQPACGDADVWSHECRADRPARLAGGAASD